MDMAQEYFGLLDNAKSEGVTWIQKASDRGLRGFTRNLSIK